MKILFLCTGNSCRSILAEAVFNHLAPSGFTAFSAGSRPVGAIHPRALDMLVRAGIATEGLSSKSWDALAQVPDLIVTVCGNAAGEVCPVVLSSVPSVHWGVDDPAAISGPESAVIDGFERAYRILRHRIEAFIHLSREPRSLEDKDYRAALVEIGTRLP